MRATRLLSVVTAMAATLLAVGCGGDDEDTGQEGAAEDGGPTAITVQETAGVPSAFLQYGVNEGFFEDEGLDVEVQPGQGGAEAIPAVISGDVQMAGSNVVSVLLASQEGLPLQIVAPGTFAQEERENDFSAVMARGNGPIQSPQDLEGKTLAVNTLDNIAEVTALEALSKMGVDTNAIELTEVPFPDMGAAVRGGDVDAAFFIEPFFTLAEQQGAEILARPYYGTQPGLQVGAYVATEQYIQENQEVVDAFARGVASTAEAIDEDPEAFRQALPEITELTPELAETVVLPDWQTESDPESLELLADLMVEYEAVEEAPEVEGLIRSPEGVEGE